MEELKTKNVKITGLTDSGVKRDHNEDAYGIEKSLGLLFVADGMGGHEAGEVASSLAVEAISDFVYECDLDFIEEHNFETSTSMDEISDNAKKAMQVTASAVVNANRRICDENVKRGMPEGRGMGTTIVGLWFLEDEDSAVVFHVGDSRLYLHRKGQEFKPVTTDHSLYHEWLKQGGQGSPPGKNIILKALGPNKEIEPEIDIIDIRKKDVFLLCSDGLNDMVSDEQIKKQLDNLDEENIEQTCKALVDMANQNGGKDNVTVVIAYVV